MSKGRNMSKQFKLRFTGKIDLLTKAGLDPILKSPNSNPITKYPSPTDSVDRFMGRGRHVNFNYS